MGTMRLLAGAGRWSGIGRQDVSEFVAELRARIDEADAELLRAREVRDDHAVDALTARLESLLRIAAQHDVDVRYPANRTD